MEWLKNNEAGSGPYQVEKWTPGQEIVYRRFADWKSGPLPEIERVVWRTVPSPGNRRALLERGDVDISFNLPPKDVSELLEENRLTVVGTPVDSCIVYIDLNNKMPPFDNLKVRQAIAHAIPYQKIMDAAMFGRGIPMFGGSGKVTTTDWPQPTPYNTDLSKAKQLLIEAGFPDGFETSLAFSIDVAVTNEPICLLVQESLAQLGIKLTLNKIPGANFRSELAKKTLPMVLNMFGAWLTVPEYFFYWNYSGQNSIFNTENYQNPAMDKLIQAARFETDPQKYPEEVEGFIAIAFADIPRILLFQPFVDVAMQKTITGYCFWYHRQLDYRQLVKT
jgi:peptide/nickel transport system substrate-binding protein